MVNTMCIMDLDKFDLVKVVLIISGKDPASDKKWHKNIHHITFNKVQSNSLIHLVWHNPIRLKFN